MTATNNLAYYDAQLIAALKGFNVQILYYMKHTISIKKPSLAF
jgi:hypothetical protein